MVAFDGGDPVAVSIGCKRPPHTLVNRIAVHPDHLRKGHGRHLLTSLSAKLAILGPPLLTAEIGAGNAPALSLFRSCGWREETSYTDHVCDDPIAAAAPAGLVESVTVDDLIDVALPAAGARRSWDRTRATLLHRSDRLSGLAIASDERIDASLLYTREPDESVAIWNLAAAADRGGEAALGVLLRELAHREPGSLRIPGAADDELPIHLLSGFGFKAGATTIGMAAEAVSRA